MQQVNLLRKIPEDTLIQVLVKLLPHCHLKLTKTHISTVGMANVTLFGQELYILQRNQ